jgi:DNA mismatch repair protein MutS
MANDTIRAAGKGDGGAAGWQALPCEQSPAMPDPRETPAMQQYYRFKKRHPDCVLLFRIGDFYELFDDDAVKVSQAIGLTLTQRTAGVPMCGMPFHQLETYLKRLTTRGFRVAVCEQLIDASLAKGVVPRAVTRVITPGTLVDESLLESDASVAVGGVLVLEAREGPARCALAVAEVATGGFTVVECPISSLVDELTRRSVRELLFADLDGSGGVPAELRGLAVGLGNLDAALVARPSWQFRSQEALDALKKHYQVATLAGFGLRDDEASVRAAGGLLAYLQETQTAGEEESREAHAALAAATAPAKAASVGPGKGKSADASGGAGSVLATVRRGSLRHLRPPRREDAGGTLVIDAVSLRSLEVERTMREGSRGMAVSGGGGGGGGGGGAMASGVANDPTLVGVFLGAGAGRGTPRTAMGKRALREWICRPLRDIGRIVERGRGVGLLVEQRELGERVGAGLARVQDIARIAGRVSLARATPRDLVGLARSIVACGEVAEALNGALALAAWHRTIAANAGGEDGSGGESKLASPLRALAAEVLATCVEEPPAHLRDGGLIREGVDPTLDEARLLERDAGAWLAQYQAELIEKHRLPSLRVGYNKVAGYFIELPEAQARSAPPELKRMQTLRNVERFTSPVLGEFERKVTTAQARALEREREIFQRLCDGAVAQVHAIGALAEAIGVLDVLLAFADKAALRGWIAPEVVERPVLAIEQGRHPVLDELLGGCVANDCDLGEGTEARRHGGTKSQASHEASSDPGQATALDPTSSLRHSVTPSLALITGPNMAGKSTYIRMVALLTILAHAGAFVPAAAMTVGLTDRVFTRIGADDALHAGQSTFMVEMVETAQILHHATSRSLVILDEVGRGTSTLDGLSLAWAIVEHLAAGGEGSEAGAGPRTLFATHYHELTELEDRMPGRVRNLHVAVREWPAGDDHAEIVFLHRILPGRTDQSYGLHVARLAGMPKGVVTRAREVLGTLAVHEAGVVAKAGLQQIGPGPLEGRAGKRKREEELANGQMALFREYVAHPAVDGLREVKLDHLTPLQAFDALRRLKEMSEEA